MKNYNSHIPNKTQNNNSRSRSRTPPKQHHENYFIPFKPSKPSVNPTKSPWAKPSTLHQPDQLLLLHEEIIDFYDFMQPSSSEKSTREELVSRIREITSGLWPKSEVFLFGSFETGLWLPNSDVDIMILTSSLMSDSELISSLSEKLVLLQIASEIEPITSATVPILKFKDKKTGIYVDICFNSDNGVSGSGLVKDYLIKYPEAKYLICVIKYFLKQRGLNDTYSGGIGSFLLFCMVIASLQQHPSRKLQSQYILRFTLGNYLAHFFKFFGEDFSFESFGISIKEHGSIFRKSCKNWGEKGNFLSVECPQNNENDLGRCSFNFFTIRNAFKHAYQLLVSQNKVIGPTPLSLLIRFDGVIENRIRNKEV